MARCINNMLCCCGVDQHRLGRVAFAGVDCSPCCCVNNYLRPGSGHRLLHCTAISDVELRTCQADNFVFSFVLCLVGCIHQLVTKLPASTRDQNLHGLALSGSHHQRLSRYQATVDSRASSSERSRFQPNLVILAISTE